MIKHLSLLFVLGFNFSFLGQMPQKASQVSEQFTSVSEWKTVSDKEFKLSYPQDWELNQEGVMGTKLVVFAPLESETDNFKENVNVIIQDLKGYDLDLASYTKLSLEQVKTMITNSKLILSRTNKLEKGGEFQELIYTGDQGIYHLKFHQYYLLKNNKAYIITFTTGIDQFEKYKTTGKAILDSFVVK
jgi:hypothetical protein